jgi:hypothetical protein
VGTLVEINSPQRRKERKADKLFLLKFLCELCVFAVEKALMEGCWLRSYQLASDALEWVLE